MWSSTNLIHYNASHWLKAKIDTFILLKHWTTLQHSETAEFFYQSDRQLNQKAPLLLNFAWPTACLTCNMLRHIFARLIIQTEKTEKSAEVAILFDYLCLNLRQLTRKSIDRHKHFPPFTCRGSLSPTKTDYFDNGSYRFKAK